MTSQTNDQQPASNSSQARESVDNWAQEEIVKIQKHCFSQGVEFKGFKQEHCVNIPPVIGIWYVTTKSKGEDYWAISGKFPTDLAPTKVAKNARQICRYFAMSWQLKAARIEEAIAEGKIQQTDAQTQQKIVEELIQKAEALASIHQDEKLWKNTGLTID